MTCVRRVALELDHLRVRRRSLSRLLAGSNRQPWVRRTLSARSRRDAQAWRRELEDVTVRTRLLTAALLATPPLHHRQVSV